jgi:hypothetical protein
MTLPLSPEMVEAAYEFLRATPPFNRWKLPPADEVIFHVTASHGYAGMYSNDGKHEIFISVHYVGFTDTLLRVLAHEIAHMRQFLGGVKSATLPHNKAFRDLTARVSKYHGFDPKEL